MQISRPRVGTVLCTAAWACACALTCCVAVHVRARAHWPDRCCDGEAVLVSEWDLDEGRERERLGHVVENIEIEIDLIILTTKPQESHMNVCHVSACDVHMK